MPQNYKNKGGQKMPPLAEVSIVLVNYKTPQMTCYCLSLLRSQFDLSQTPVIVVDNDSQDASTDYLAQQTDITCIERKGQGKEQGFKAHGLGLDLAFEKVTTPYVLTIHTDTLIHDATLVTKLIEQMQQNPDIAVIGSNQQRARDDISYFWRKVRTTFSIAKRRLLKGYARALDKKIKEQSLKSFFCLYRSDLIRQHQLSFFTATQNPGYDLQHGLKKAGFQIINWPRKDIFSSIDHIQSGTVIENALKQQADSPETCEAMNPRRFQAYQGAEIVSPLN